MALNIFVSKIQDGSMKSVHDGDMQNVNVSRMAFMRNNNIDPESTTLVRLKYEGDDYCRYSTVGDEYKGDGITRESTLTSDALVVTDFNHAVFLPLADCIGVVLHDTTRNILMVSHLGRHNLEQFGGTKSVEYLVKNHNIEPKNLDVWFSPAAGKDSYPLYSFDNRSLYEVAIEQLSEAGVLVEKIKLSPIDSAISGEYYSHSQFLKGNKETDGRFAIVACMKDDE